MFEFIADLDNYFCEKYANYDRLCVLPEYKMPKMQTSEIRADGRMYAYTLPLNTMRLAKQEKKAELLALLKEQMLDKTYSFSFRPLGFFHRILNKYGKKGFVKNLKATLSKYNLTEVEAGEPLNIHPKIWRNIYKGNYLPTKNLLFSLAITTHMNIEDLLKLMQICGVWLDYTIVKDVVLSYLIEQKIFNPSMVAAALKEYKVENLFIKEIEE